MLLAAQLVLQLEPLLEPRQLLPRLLEGVAGVGDNLGTVATGARLILLLLLTSEARAYVYAFADL